MNDPHPSCSLPDSGPVTDETLDGATSSGEGSSKRKHRLEIDHYQAIKKSRSDFYSTEENLYDVD
jgi:hypothetical protein